MSHYGGNYTIIDVIVIVIAIIVAVVVVVIVVDNDTVNIIVLQNIS